MPDKNLRAKLIRLAHSKPELRGDLLPLLSKQAASIKPLPGLPGVFFEVLPENQYTKSVQFYINRDHDYIKLHRYGDLYAPDVKAWLGLAADLWSNPTGFDWVKTPLEEMKQHDVSLKVLRTVQRMDDYLNGKTAVGKLNNLGLSADLAYVLPPEVKARYAR